VALAVTHVLIAILVLDIFRHYLFGLKRFPRYLLVVGGIAGLLPDIDIPLGWILGKYIHGAFTHSLFFVLALLLIGIVSHYQKEITRAKWFYVIAAGWFIHILLDCLFNAYSTFLWPLAVNTTAFCPAPILGHNYGAAIDAIILVAWLVHEEAHKKIKDYF